MQYFKFEFDPESQKLCVISTPFGLYKYKRLPMGIKQSSDIAQEVMENLFCDLGKVKIYIDDVDCFLSNFKAHIQTLDVILTHLEQNGFKVNSSKCEWAVKEIDWLGYWLKPTGLKPWSKKINTIIAMQAPTNIKQVCSFIGAVTYYCDMWPRRSQILAPLTNLTGKGTFYWSDIHQQSFDAMKALIVEDVLLQYPDHNLPFQINTDVSNYQLGLVIIQQDIPVAYYSCKRSLAQQNYTTIEKELLSVVETLKNFRSMFLSAEIQIYTDHHDLTYKTLTTQHVLHWCLFIEEFHPTFHCIKGVDNVVADALFRLPIKASVKVEIIQPNVDLEYIAKVFSIKLDNESLLECLLHHPHLTEEIVFPLDYSLLHSQQLQDIILQQQQQHNPEKYPIINLDGIELICYITKPGESWCIAILDTLLDIIIKWYHQILSHIGMTRLYNTISVHFYHQSLKK